MTQTAKELASEERRLPDGWKWANLNDVCEVILGQSPPGSTYRKVPDGLPFFQGKADFGEVNPSATTWCIAPTKIAIPGDILMSVRAPVGPTNIANVKCCIGRGLAAIRCRESVERDFIHKYLSLIETQIAAIGSGSTFSAVTGNQLKSLRIPLPPIAEQKRIAAILNEQMAAVEKARKAAEARLEAARALPAAYLRQVFESPEAEKWPARQLGEILKLRNEVIHPRDNPTGSAAFVGLQHIESHTGRRIGLDQIEKSELTGRKPAFYAGDIVYGYLRPYLNKVWVADIDGLCSVDQYVFKVNPTLARSDYVCHFMRSPVFLNRAPIDETPGQLPRIRTAEVASVYVNLPTLEEQANIESHLVEIITSTEKLTSSISTELDALASMPSSLLRKAFSGEL